MIPKNRQDVYRALLRKGMSERLAAMISWAGKTKLGRKKMARKAAATRRRGISRRGR